jgi:Ethanolamine utilization protein EutJ (predicted chaperonin)
MPVPDVAPGGDVNLAVDMGGITYSADDLTPASHHALTVAVHDTLTGLGFEPYVRAHGITRDEWGALRFAEDEGRRITRRSQ